MNVDWKLVLEGATALAATVAFVVGLMQYRRAQQWKRAEFLAQEMKELFADVKCTNTLTMIDWAAREIPLGAFSIPPDSTRIAVDYVQQSDALRPHDFEALIEEPSSASSPGAAEQAGEPAASKDRDARFDPRQTLIRDCYDGLLDRWDRMGSYVTRGLVSVEDLRPYIGYYINDITAAAKNPVEAIWGSSLLTYIIFYHFDGVAALFKAFGKDIGPDGSIFIGFVERAGPYRNRAEKLQEVARVEWTDILKTLPRDFPQ